MNAQEKIRPGYKQTEIGLIPEDWDVKTLDELFTFGGGYAASRDQLSTEGYCYLHYGDIHGSAKTSIDTKADYEDIPKFNVPLKQISPKSLLKDGDVVFVDASEDNDGTSKHVVVVNKDNVPFISGLHTIIAKGKTNELCNEYRHYCFQTAAIRQQFLFYAVGTKVTGISKKNIAKLKLPIPPLPEQRAIAAALGDADALIAALEALIAKKRDLKQAAMQQLLTGKTRLPGFTGKWEVKRLEKVASIRNEKINTLGVDVASFCVELEQIGQNTGQVEGYSDARGRRSVKYRFQKGDVLFGRLRPYLRKFWHADREGVCSTEIWPLIPIDGQLGSGFLFQTVQTEAFIEAANSSYGTHMPRSDWKALTQFEVLVPSDRVEQTAIAAILSDMDADLAALEARRDKARALKQGMMQELLTGRIRLV